MVKKKLGRPQKRKPIESFKPLPEEEPAVVSLKGTPGFCLHCDEAVAPGQTSVCVGHQKSV